MSSAARFARPVLFLLLCPVILIFTGPLAQTLPPTIALIAIGALASVATLLLTKLFVRWDGLSLSDVGTAVTRRSPSRLATGALIGSALVALQVSLIQAGGHAHWIDGEHRSFGAAILVLLGYMALASREELAFRGYPLRRLASVWGRWPALVLISGIFAIEHLGAGWSWWRLLLGPLPGGLMFGMAALATRGLAVPLGIHWAFNSAQWLVGQKDIPGVWKPVIDAGFEGQAEVLGYSAYAAGTVAITFGFWLWKRRL